MNSFALSVFSLLVLGASAGTLEKPSCYRLKAGDEQWEKSTIGFEYRLFAPPNVQNFNDALSLCRSFGGDLAMDKSQATHDYLTNWLGDVGMDIWIGNYQENGQMICVCGANVTVDFWATNSTKSQRCIVYQKDGTGWNSADCTTEKAFICQRPIDYKCSECAATAVMSHYMGRDEPVASCAADVTDSFQSAQCESTVEGSHCHCANEDGTKIKGSDATLTSAIPFLAMVAICDTARLAYANSTSAESACETKKRETTGGVFSPACQENGEFEVRQCYKNTFCWCSMGDGTVVPDTLHAMSDKTDEFCWKFRAYQATCAAGDMHIEHSFDNHRFISCGAETMYSCYCAKDGIFNAAKKECVHL